MDKVGFSLKSVGDREIVISRRFAATRALVFDAWTTPVLVKRWLTGPPGWTMPTCRIDLKVGGDLRYVWRHTDGREMGLSGRFIEIVPVARLVHTELFDEDWTGGETRVTTTFTEADDGTTVLIEVRYASAAARAAAARSGMEQGVIASYDRLDALLKHDAFPTRVISIESRMAGVVRKTVAMADMADAQRAAHAILDAAGLKSVGPRLTVWRPPHAGRIDYAPGRIVTQPFEDTGDLTCFTLPEGRAAHLRLTGGYEALPAAWARLFGDCAREGWTPAGVNWEIYAEMQDVPETDLYALLI